MRSKPLMILLVLAVVLVGLAIFTGRKNDAAPSPVIGKLVLPDLAVNDVEQLTIVNQQTTATIARVEGTWVVAEKHNYPANFERVRNALIKLSELKIGDTRRSGGESRKEFGIATPGPSLPDATRVSLQGKDGRTLAGLLLGKHHLRKDSGGSPYGGDYPDGRYLSVEGRPDIYMVKDTLTDFTADPLGWMDTEIVNIDAALVDRISITGPDRAPVEMVKTADGNGLRVTGITDNEEADAGHLASARSALNYLNAQDVADPKLSDAAMGFDKAVTFTTDLSDGRVFKLLIGAKSPTDGRYLRCRVEFKEPSRPATNALASATNAPPAPDYTAIRTGVDTLNRKLAPWTFVMPSYKADAMLVTRAELVKPKAKPEPAAEAAPKGGTNAPPAKAPPVSVSAPMPPMPPAPPAPATATAPAMPSPHPQTSKEKP